MKIFLAKVGVFALSVFTILFAVPQVAYAAVGQGPNQLRAEAGPGAGQVTLNWVRAYADVTSYNIAYGTKPGVYQYSVQNIGNNVVYTIGGLRPGVKYFFLLQPYNGNTALPPVTAPISAVASRTARTVIGTAGPFGARQFTAKVGPKSGQVTLKWLTVSTETTGFSIVYGTAPGKYQYGVQNLSAAPNGQWNTYTVSSLQRGRRYYFAVVPVRGGSGIYNSGEVSQVAR